MNKRYSLHITISTLIIFITLLLATVLTWQSYNKTSSIILENARELYERITRELELDIKATYGPVAGGLRQFRLSPVINAYSFDQRIAYLATFQAALESNPAISSVGIGYTNGDYLGVSTVDNQRDRERFDVPDGAAFIVTYIKNAEPEAGFEAFKKTVMLYDKSLNEIDRSPPQDTRFDSRQRPWYQQATEVPSATSPYLFNDNQTVGLTAMIKTNEPGVVVMFDITLEDLSRVISRYQLTRNSEIVVINADGKIFAYKNQDSVVVQTLVGNKNKVQLASMKQLGSDVLSHASTYIKEKEQDFDFQFDGQHWIGSARVVGRPGGVDLYALMMSPVDELLNDAVRTRNEMLIYALFVLLAFIPLIWYVAKKISTPMHALSDEAEAIARFDFDARSKPTTFISEVVELDSAVEMMKSTISQFINLINSLASEQDLDALLKSITRESMQVCQSDAALIYLMDEQDDLLKATYLCDKAGNSKVLNNLPPLSLDDLQTLFDKAERNQNKSCVIELKQGAGKKLSPLLSILNEDQATVVVLPLLNRSDDTVGLLCYVFPDTQSIDNANSIDFIEALSGFAAVTLESRQLLNRQEALLDAFIRLIAGAIDAKSPYTGGHCARVPELTLMLARAACDSENETFRDFDLDEEQWHELGIAGWLHDCGKVTTPEYVVDKATKLETIYDRIHEIRMRFEVLKRDAEITCWQQIADGGNREQLLAELVSVHKEIDDDFAFIAACNVGGEFMAEERIERLQQIAKKTWQRTLDDRLGVSWEEARRKQQDEAAQNSRLPVTENILSDKVEHLITRNGNDRIPADNPWGFDVNTPEYKYNRGELYNLSVKKGTLNEEERYMINGHMLQTVMMLDKLPFPKKLQQVPLIAGSHHETMDGKGYPKKLKMSEQPLTARMMVIADIFEALTASDRPYKKAKTLSESIRIMGFMCKDKHIDPDLFELFLTSGVYQEYADKFLSADQIDEITIQDYTV